MAIGIALAIGLLLVAARGAGAGTYTVAQCGWGVGVDATWIDTNGGGGFQPESSCQPIGLDPLAGTPVGSFTGEQSGIVEGGQYAAWRWTAPPGTGIVAVAGRWSHVLQDGFEQRLTTDPGDGSLAVFAAASAVDPLTVPTPFSASFAAPRVAFEDQLLCAHAPQLCILDSRSWSSLNALAIRMQDFAAPQVGIGGHLVAGGWQRGVESAVVSGADVGSGLRFGELRIDGLGVAKTEYPCAKADIEGWVATQMRPCQPEVNGALALDTAGLGDGPHAAATCVADFSENLSCTPDRQVLVDNNPPEAPRRVEVAGSSGRNRAGAFDVFWSDPDQGPGSPVAKALWRITGPGGYDTGVRVEARREIAGLENLKVPGAGEFTLRLWLRDAAGNGSRATAVSVPLRDGVHFGRTGRGKGAAPRRGRSGAGAGDGGTRVRLLVHLRTGDAGPGPSPGWGDRQASGHGGLLTVPFGAGATVAGRLVDDGSAGIAGRRLRIAVRPWRGAHAAATRRTVTTGRRGGFELPLAPGPSRRVSVDFAGGNGLGPAHRGGFDLRVRGGVSLRAAPAKLETGQEVHLSGRVHRLGASIPHPGKLVAIQYLEATTHRWRPVLVIRGDSRGRFDTSYRFRYVSGAARIQLRATALAEDRWPYAPGSSRPVTVAVHGR